MDLIIILVLLTGLLLLVGLPGVFLFRAGRRRGAQLAYAAITKGIGHHCDTPDGRVPEDLGKAIDAARRAPDLEQLLLELRAVGDQMGKACWQNGYDYAGRVMRSTE